MHVHDLLEVVAALPLAAALRRLPQLADRLFGRYLSSDRWRDGYLRLARQELALLVFHYPEARERVNHLQCQRGDEFLKAVGGKQHDTMAGVQEGVATLTERTMSNAARPLLRVLRDYSHQLPADYAFGDSESGTPKKDDVPELYPIPESATTDESLRHWLWLAENFVALQIVAYLGRYFRQMRSMLTYTMVAPVLLLLVIASYPYQPQRPLLLLVLALFAAALVEGIVILRRMEHDTVLSRVANTTPNRITFDSDFFSTVTPYLLPVAGVILTLFSEFTGVLSSWLGSVWRVFQ
jgi:hypothetical protein